MTPNLLRFTGHALLLLILLLLPVHGAEVASFSALQDCLMGTAAECVIPANTTIYKTGLLSSFRSLTIRGSGNSVIDLGWNSNLMALPADETITIVDLEIRNGRNAEGSLLLVSAYHSINLTRVVVRNMYADTSGGAVKANGGTGHLSEVTFINCTASGGFATAFYGTDIDGWTLQNLSFINSSLAGNPIPPPHMTISTTAKVNTVSIGGYMRFQGLPSQYQEIGASPAVSFIASVGFPLYIESPLSYPSHWLFQNCIQNLISIVAGSPVHLKLGSLSSDATLSTSSNAFVFNILADNPVVIDVGGALSVLGHGILDARTQVSFRVDGPIFSTRCPTSVFRVTQPSAISATDVLVDSYLNGVMATGEGASLNLTVQNDFKIRGTQQPTYHPQIDATYGDITIKVGNEFNTSNHYSFQATVLVRKRLSISAKTIAFQSHTASNAGVISIDDEGHICLNASQSITFKDNISYGNGGALFIGSPNATVSFPGNVLVLFEGNYALGNGGAIYVYDRHLESFRNASFWSNTVVGSGCAIFVADEVCAPFMPTSFGQNTQTVSTNCESLDLLCDANPINPDGSTPFDTPYLTPSASPTAESPCLGDPPTLSSVCQGGVWIVPSEELEEVAPTIIISSPIIISGNLTTPVVTVTNVLGNGEPILQSNGCISVGQIVVTLSEEDLKSLEKSGSRTALLTRSSCPSNAEVVTNGSPTRSCKKIETEPIRSGGSLSAAFRINSSRCNVWWIVLISVIGVVVIGVVVAIAVIQTRKRMAYNQDVARLK